MAVWRRWKGNGFESKTHRSSRDLERTVTTDDSSSSVVLGLAAPAEIE